MYNEPLVLQGTLSSQAIAASSKFPEGSRGCECKVIKCDTESEWSDTTTMHLARTDQLNDRAHDV